MKKGVNKPHGVFKEIRQQENHKEQEPVKLTDTEVKQMGLEMQVEDEKETGGNTVNVDDVYTKKYCNKDQLNNIDLRDKKNTKKPEYDIDDTIIKDITLNGDIHVRLISNINGYFIDIRKYIKSYPTKKGIRFLASKFMIAFDMLKDDLSKCVPGY
jgi:hypothetical protein